MSDRVEIIPASERIEELERDVLYFMTVAPEPSIVSETIHKRVEIEVFRDEREQLEWEIQEIMRCKDGFLGMSGKMYFYFNYGWILNVEEGKIPPEYRVSDDDWFSFVEEQQASKEWGIVCVKRRRVGASWKEASDVLHDALFRPYFKIAMNSKSDLDSIELFKKVKFLYSNLPSFLRVRSTASNTKSFMDFSYYAKTEDGSRIKKGNQSEIVVVAPVATALEGRMLNKWVCDEAGKQKDLTQMWTYTEECLRQETKRIGIPILFGTSGEVGKEGAGLREMWKNSDAYKLRRYFFAGWNGLMIDEYGNDETEHAIRWIVYERYRRRNLGAKSYTDFIQQYPLTTEEAFKVASTGGVGNIIKINSQLASLREEPVDETKGSFVMDADGQIIWKPSLHGKAIMYENRIKGVKNLYNAGCDPADHDDVVVEDASDLSLIIMRKQHGLHLPKVVFDYTDRPEKVADFYRQALYAIQYYNTKILIERNRYKMIADFDTWGYKHLLSTTPQGVARLTNTSANTIGINMNESVKEYMENLIEAYIEDYWEQIPSEKLLEECVKYGSVNTDALIAWGICLIQQKEDEMVRRRVTVGSNKLKLPGYVKDRSGKIVRI